MLDRRPTELAHQELALLTVILLVATACAARLGIGRSYSGWDDMAIWSVKGYGIAREGSIWAAGQWGDHGLGYPLNIPLLITIFRMGGDALPASKLIFPLFYLSACAGCLRFWLQRGVATRTAILGAIGLATTPIVFEHATLGYANLPYATYLLLAVGESTQGIMTRDARRQALGGVLFGLAAWTRPEGFLVIGLVMLVMAVVAWRIRPGGLRLVAWISAAVVLAGSWSLFVRLHAPGGQMVLAVRAAVQGWGQGDLHLGALLYIARFMGRQAFEFAVWGMLPFVCLGLMLLGVRKLGPRSNPDVFLLSAVLIMAAAGIMVQFYLADFIGQLVNYLGNSANRMYLPVAVMAVLLVLLLTRATHPTGPSPDVPGTRDGGASLATSTDA